MSDSFSQVRRVGDTMRLTLNQERALAKMRKAHLVSADDDGKATCYFPNGASVRIEQRTIKALRRKGLVEYEVTPPERSNRWTLTDVARALPYVTSPQETNT